MGRVAGPERPGGGRCAWRPRRHRSDRHLDETIGYRNQGLRYSQSGWASLLSFHWSFFFRSEALMDERRGDLITAVLALAGGMFALLQAVVVPARFDRARARPR